MAPIHRFIGKNFDFPAASNWKSRSTDPDYFPTDPGLKHWKIGNKDL
ncbi:hypothetical protein ACFQI7_37040 [Paenibacillus allorhizosphaerae]|nr:hypothetical protein [Paenibacillus allorhizosphaerae]